MPVRVTLKDVAAAAGVARSTVSMALNNDPRIAAATRAAIREVADRLGYRPDPALTALAAHRAGKRKSQLHAGLAVLHNRSGAFASQGFWGRVHLAMKEEADALGYYLDEVQVELGLTEAKKLSRILRARGIQGVFFFPTFGDTRTIELEWERFALVGMEFGRPRVDIPHVIRDFFAASFDASVELRRLGCRRLGLVISPGFKPAAIARMLGGFTAWQTLDGDPRPVPPLVNPAPGDLGPWLIRHKPDAVLDWSVQTLGEIRALGVRVPEEMAFACVQSVMEARDPAIAGIHHSAARLGSETVRIAHRFLLAGNVGLARQPLTALIPGEWLDGESARLPAP